MMLPVEVQHPVSIDLARNLIDNQFPDLWGSRD